MGRKIRDLGPGSACSVLENERCTTEIVLLRNAVQVREMKT